MSAGTLRTACSAAEVSACMGSGKQEKKEGQRTNELRHWLPLSVRWMVKAAAAVDWPAWCHSFFIRLQRRSFLCKHCLVHMTDCSQVRMCTAQEKIACWPVQLIQGSHDCRLKPPLLPRAFPEGRVVLRVLASQSSHPLLVSLFLVQIPSLATPTYLAHRPCGLRFQT